MATGFDWIGFLNTAGFAAVVSGIVSAVTWFANAKREDKNKNDATESALRVLLSIEIKQLCQGYIKRGYITFDELEDVERMNAVYHDKLNGNGFIKSVITETENLPRHATKK